MQETNAQNCQTVFHLLGTRDGSHAQAIALMAPSRPPFTFEALTRQTADTAAALRRENIGRADKVAVVVPNGPEMAAAFLAVASAAVCAPLNPGYGEDEFRFYLGDIEAKALMLPVEYNGAARTVANDMGILCLDIHWNSDWPAGRFELTDERSAGHGVDLSAHPDDLALILHTSGTTSRPKIVPITHRSLCASAFNVGRSLELSAQDRCLNVMPLFHIHGLVAALLASLASGGSVACTPGFRDGQFLPWLNALRPTWITAVPTIHQAILAELARHPAGAAASRLRLVRSSSAALSPAVMRDLEAALQAPVIEAYGMTEAAHQMASNPLPPRKRRPGSVGLAAGPDLAIMDDGGRLLPAGTTGEIVIRGDNVTRGYLDNPHANAEAYTDGWFRTGDQGLIDADGYVYLTGRLKEIINRGGEKVSPREVDEALLEHAAVRQAVAFGVRHQSLGEDLAAAVVLKDGATATADEIRAFLFGRLAEHKIPSRIVVVDEIPKGATGKIQRIGLEAKLAAQLKPAFAPPRDVIEAQVAEVFSEVLGIDNVGAFDNFFALGGDSIRGFQTLTRLRTRLQVELPIFELFRGPTVAQVAQGIAAVRQAAENAVLERILSEVELLSEEEAGRRLRDLSSDDVESNLGSASL